MSPIVSPTIMIPPSGTASSRPRRGPVGGGRPGLKMKAEGGLGGLRQAAFAPGRGHHRLDGKPRLAAPKMVEVDQGAVLVEHRQLDVADERAKADPCHAPS